MKPDLKHGSAFLAAIGAAGVLTGCATFKANETRIEQTDAFTNRLSVLSADLLAQPLSLHDAISIAMTNNYSVRKADLDAELARLGRKSSFSAFLPQVSASVDYYNYDKDPLTSSKDFSTEKLNVGLPIFMPSTWFLYAASRHGVAAGAISAHYTRQSIALKTTQNYFNILVQQDLIKAYETQLDAAKTNARRVSGLAKEGLFAKWEGDQAVFQAESREVQLKQAKRELEVLRAQFLADLGLDPEADFTLSGDTETAAFASLTPNPKKEEKKEPLHIPNVTITTAWVGASAADVENGISKKIEKAVAGLEGLEAVQVSNLANVSDVTLKFKAGFDGEAALRSVQERLGAIRKELPAQAKQPVVLRTDNISPVIAARAFRADEASLDELVLHSITNHPLLSLADRQVVMQEHAVRQAFCDFIPTLKAFGTKDWTGNDVNSRSGNITLGFNGAWTVFNGFANVANYQASKVKRQQSNLERENTFLSIIVNVVSADANLQTARDAETIRRRAFEVASEKYADYDAKNREGLIPLGDALDARAAMDMAQVDMVKSRYQVKTALAALEFATGSIDVPSENLEKE